MAQLILLSITTIVAAIAAIFAALSYFRTRSASTESVITKDILSQALRSESEFVRAAGDENARGLRKELADALRSLQDGTLSAFTKLSEFIRSQIQDFGKQLDAGTNDIEKRIEGISAKLDEDLNKMGVDADRNRDTLRQTIEFKLDQAIEKQSLTSKDLREELNSSFERLRERVIETLNEASAHQKERLDNSTDALTSFGEKHEKSQEILRQVVEARLDRMRSENTAKFDELVSKQFATSKELREELNSSFDRLKKGVADTLTQSSDQQTNGWIKAPRR
jgi:DNA recombination protein RmuC